MFALQMRQIYKRFGSMLANDGVDFSVVKGEIHALVGENGAGKSTLMNILYGVHRPDQGTIHVGEKLVSVESPAKAISLGIGMVHQHFMLFPTLSVTENIILGKEPTTRLGTLNLREAEKTMAELSSQYRLLVDPIVKVDSLSIGQQQRVELLKLLYRNADILILDEPTPVLTPQEIEDLFQTLRNFKALGKTVILITHKLSEVMTISDSVTVMRRGMVITRVETASTNQVELARFMVGRDVDNHATRLSPPSSEHVLVAENVSALSDRRLRTLKNVSFSIRRGEIFGIAAVEGNGQSELVEVITGLRRPTEGKVTINGQDYSSSPTRFPVSHIPEDRARQGLVLDFTLTENMILGRQFEKQFSGTFKLAIDRIEMNAEELIGAYDIRPPNKDHKARQLSGGNQQKVVIARELSKNAALIVASQPTRGLDIGAIEFVHTSLMNERNKGKAILLVSSDLEELLKLCDRIAVMYEGEIVLIVDAAKTTERALGAFMTGATRERV